MRTRIYNSPRGWSDRARDIEDELEVVGWSKEGQLERFHAVEVALGRTFPNQSLLDYGCGLGAFAGRVNCPYTGYDWSPAMIERAKAKNPGFYFTNEMPEGKFDLVVCIGTFNVPGQKHTNWGEMRRLWERCRHRMVVSLYAGNSHECLRYTEEECSAFASGLGILPLEIRRHRHNDIIFVLWR